jgi:hypothetical protein
MITKPDCPMCDEDCYKPNGTVCDHIDRSGVHERGMAKVRDALAHIRKREVSLSAPAFIDLVERQRKAAPPQPITEDPEPEL